MKKILLTLAMLFLAPICTYSADKIVPSYVSLEYNNTFGVYQAPNEILIFQEPSEDSNLVQSVRKSVMTLAPEAGSQRLRNVIKKNITEEQILNAVLTLYAVFSIS